MSNPPTTPSRVRVTPLVAGTPSPRKLQEWDQGVAQASDRHKRVRENTEESIRNLLYDDTETVQTREAAAYTLYECLRSAMTHNGLEFEFAEELATVQNDLNNFVVEDTQNMGYQELHQVLGPNRAAATGATNEVQENDKWNQALHEHGLQQGQGTADAPLYTGARDLKEEPQPIQVGIDVTDHTDVARIEEIQKNLFIAFSDLTYHGFVNRRRLYMKLHPWAVTNWVNFFTGMILGAKGINKINAVIAAASRANEHGDTYQDIQRAKLLSHNQQISQQERMLFDTIAHVIDTDMPKSNAYTKFVNTCSCAVLYQKFLGLVAEVQNNPAGEVGRSLQRQRARGRSVRDRIVQVCAANMKWSVEKFNELLERHAALSSCGLAFSGGFLLLVDDKMRSIIKNNVKAAMPALIPIVKREFPELEPVCTQFYSTICRPLMSPDPAISTRITSMVIDSTKGEMNMVERIRTLLN